MRFRIPVMLLWLLGSVMPPPATAAGTVVNTSYFSPALNQTRLVQIYLPEGYSQNPSATYPCIYFLHGAYGTHLQYSDIIQTANALIAAGTIRPTIIVKPSGAGGPWGLPLWWNSERIGAGEDAIVQDLRQFIETTYRVTPQRSQRCIMGHSAGGDGAMSIAMHNPGLFAGVAAHSGALDLNHLIDFVPLVRAENGGAPPYTYDPLAGDYTGLCFRVAAIHSPNPSNPPYFVDFFLDQSGVVIDSTFGRWLSGAPMRDALRLLPAERPAVYSDCATNDPFHLFPFDEAFADSLNAGGYPIDWEPYSGTGHYSPPRISHSLAFLDSVMTASAADIAESSAESELEFDLGGNPTRGEVSARFALPSPGAARLELWDVVGRRVADVKFDELNAGRHAVPLSLDPKLPAGSYWLRLEVGHHAESRRLVLVR